MRLHFRHGLALVACSCALSACGGGGGGSPTPAPTNNSDRPHGAGDSFTYAGALTERFVRAPLQTPPLPSPNPASSATISLAIAQTVTLPGGTIASPQLPGLTSALYAIAETDTQSAPFAVSQTTENDSYQFSPDGASTDVRLTNTVVTDKTTGASLTTTYGPNAGLVDVIPDAAGTLPANDAAGKTVETDPQGATATRTTNADGTYTETTTSPDAANGSAAVAADGSGSYAFPLFAGNGAMGNTSFVVAPPVGNAIAVTITYAAGLAGPTPLVVRRSVPAWYALPVVLATSSLQDLGKTVPPAACALTGSLATSATAVVAKTHAVDPVFGETDDRITTTYDEPGVGVACVQMTDVVAQYYDFSGQSVNVIETTANGAPLQTTSTTETLGLTKEMVLGLESVARHTTGALFSAAVRASTARFDARLATARIARHAALARALRRRFR